MQSHTLPLYDKWLETATPDDIEFVDTIYSECEDHYDDGGDTIVEHYSPAKVIETFKNGPINIYEFCTGGDCHAPLN